MKASFFSFVCVVALLMVATTARGQSRVSSTPADDTGRDAVGFRMDHVTKETVGETNAPRSPSTKQAIEDFLELQKSNRHILDVSKASPLAFDQIIENAKEVNKRANRLKTSLNLPKPPKSTDQFKESDNPSIEEMKGQIEQLNQYVKAFVTNPMFRNLQAADKDLPSEASENLRNVIELSRALQKNADKLRHNGSQQ